MPAVVACCCRCCCQCWLYAVVAVLLQAETCLLLLHAVAGWNMPAAIAGCRMPAVVVNANLIPPPPSPACFLQVFKYTSRFLQATH